MNINKEKISNLILATKYHSIDQLEFASETNNLPKGYLNPKYTEEIKLFLDIDLYIFTEDFQKYCDNIEKVRKEFELFNDEEWKKGRLDFLNRLSKRKRIFYTELFYNKYEEIARENIRRDIEKTENMVLKIFKGNS
jgi:predicted metal-dependent HD superfamily phosphohydrolase